MNIKNFISIFFILLFIDALYLSIIRNIFESQIISVQKVPIKLNIISAILCYFFLSIAFNYFIIDKKSSSIIDSMVLGLVIYGVYETTCKAILIDWKWSTVILDILWGTILYGLVYIVSKKLKIN